MELAERTRRGPGLGKMTMAAYECAFRPVMTAILLGLLTLVSKVGAEEREETVAIATGQVGGLYHPIGGVICKLAIESLGQYGISCTVDISGGSIPNIRELQKGNVELAIVQSDLQFDATSGTGPFEDLGPFKTLRSMFSLYVEHFTIVARDDRSIDTFDDLKGKRVYVGQVASSQREAMDVLMDAHGWTGGEITGVSDFEGANLAEALCDGEFDAFVYTIGNPNPTVREATALCQAKLVEVSAPIIDRLTKENPFYVHSVIPGGTYKDIPKDVQTVGVVATLVTTARVPTDVVYEITKSYFETLDLLRAISPLFLSLTEVEMVKSGLTAPIHPGALKYFSESGLE